MRPKSTTTGEYADSPARLRLSSTIIMLVLTFFFAPASYRLLPQQAEGGLLRRRRLHREFARVCARCHGGGRGAPEGRTHCHGIQAATVSRERKQEVMGVEMQMERESRYSRLVRVCCRRSILDAIALYYALITSDNCNTIAAQLDGEVWEDYCSTLITGVRLPPKAKDIVSYILRNVMKDVKAATITKQSRERTVADVSAHRSDMRELTVSSNDTGF
jgi:hypothetical protein